jgi:hypothetical protein
MRDYPTLHLDTDLSEWTACSKKGYGCKKNMRDYPTLHLDTD